MNNCLQCNTLTKNPKFCSKSCAGTYNGKKYPKRKPEHKCAICQTPINAKRKYCGDHDPRHRDYSTITLADMQSLRSYQISSRIRERARQTYRKSTKPKLCTNCGYDKHYEVCHIKAINSFSLDTPISVINDISNLVALCPNCHWEFDNNKLTIKNF